MADIGTPAVIENDNSHSACDEPETSALPTAGLPMSVADWDKRVVALSLLNPHWGHDALARHLRSQGHPISNADVRDVLARNSLVHRRERLQHLELLYDREAVTLTPQQVRLLEKANPCFRERFMESSRPGECIAQESFFVGQLLGLGNVYLHSVVDTFASFAFAAVRPTKGAANALALLRDRVLPFYRGRGLRVGAIMTDNGREFAGTQSHQFTTFLADHAIEHFKAMPGHHGKNGFIKNGFIERFINTVVFEFFADESRNRPFATFEELQAELDAWLIHYNYRRSHEGYRNYGRPPSESIGAGPLGREHAWPWDSASGDDGLRQAAD